MATKIYGSVFMSENAHNTAQSFLSSEDKPMKVVRAHVNDALEHHGYDPQTTLSFDFSFDTDDYDDSNSDLGELLDIWRANWLDGHFDASQHFNLLLLNENEWPNPAGNVGVGTVTDEADDNYPRGSLKLGSEGIGTHDTSPDRYGDADDSVEGQIRGAIHEIGHNLGMVHHDGLRYDEVIDEFGTEVTRATSMGCTSKDNWETSCGSFCSTDSTDSWDHYYGDCEISNISL